MIIYNNLMINMHSGKYRPFLVNLLSGRRRVLNKHEFDVLKRISCKRDLSEYDELEIELYNQLTNENQFLSDEKRSTYEARLKSTSLFDINKEQADDFRFSIELTRSCNMSCSYCYARERLNDGQSMTREHIDAIFEFYRTFSDEESKVLNVPYIRITGGEPLVTKGSLDLLNYIAAKWESSRLILFTNGINILKYFDLLPLSNIEEVHVSLDGIKDVHLERRFDDIEVDSKIYDDIIEGICKLLTHKVNVKIKTVLDKSNYLKYEELIRYLKIKGILDSPYCEIIPGFRLDYENELDLSEEFNNVYDVKKIKEKMKEINIPAPSISSCSTLFKILSRPKNEPYIPKHQRCKSSFLTNYYFSCNGNVYFCDHIQGNDKSIGTFYPLIDVNEDDVNKLMHRSVFLNEKCEKCAYKFVCLGGCPVSSRAKQLEMSCGIFGNEEILDNLEYDLNWI